MNKQQIKRAIVIGIVAVIAIIFMVVIGLTEEGNTSVLNALGINAFASNSVITEDDLQAGQYIKYTDANGDKVKCVVLYDKAYNEANGTNYGVQIITADKVEEKELGNGTGTESTQTNNETYFNIAKDVYNNTINILNAAAEEYRTANTDLVSITSDARCVGSIPDNKNSENSELYSNEYDYFSAYNNQFKAGENANNYKTDLNQMQKLDIHKLKKDYWLASRVVYASDKNTSFRIHSVYSSGILNSHSLFFINPNGAHSSSFTYGLRPVFTLNSDVIVTGGSGTEEDPYTLGVGNYSITSNSTTKYVETLSDAVAVAENGDTITVLQDITDESEVTVNKNITLDTNGKIITRSKTIKIDEANTLNVEGSGTIKGTFDSKIATMNVSENAILNISDVTIDRESIDNPSWETIELYGTLNVNSGTIHSPNNNAICTYSGYNTHINIKGGLITGQAASNPTISNKGTLVIEEGEIIAEASSAITNYKTVEFIGGKAQGELHGIYNAVLDATVNIGSLKSEVNINNPIVVGKTSGIYNVGICNFNSGIIKGATDTYTGNDIVIRSGFKISTGTETIDGDKYTTVYLEKITDKNYCLLSNSTGYDTLSEAYLNAATEDTITILNTGFIDESAITMAEQKNIILNTEINEVTFTNPITVSTSKLTITGWGKIKNSNSNTIELLSDAILDVRNGMVESTNGAAIHENGNNSEIILGSTEDEVNRTDPIILGQTYGVSLENTDSSKMYFCNGVIKGKTAALTGDITVENISQGITRQNYISEKYDESEYKCLALKQSNINITSNPERLISAEGEIATFKVIAECESDLNYQWYVNTTDNVFEGTLIEGATDNTYTISAAKTNDEGYYYCKVTSNNGEKQVSSTAKLSIENNFAITTEGNTKYYGMLSSALDAVQEEQTIKLLKNVATDEVASINKNVYIDLQEYTLTPTNTILILDNGILNIVGRGKIENEKSYILKNEGTLNVISGTLQAQGHEAIYNCDNATTNIYKDANIIGDSTGSEMLIENYRTVRSYGSNHTFRTKSFNSY